MGSDLRAQVPGGDGRDLRCRPRGVGAFPSRTRRLICGESQDREVPAPGQGAAQRECLGLPGACICTVPGTG